MRWVIQRGLYNESGAEALTGALRDLGLPFSVHQVIPFADELRPDVSASGKIIAMGAQTMMRIAQQRGWDPGVYTGPGFSFERWRQRWGERLLNADAEVGRLDALSPVAPSLFVRPAEDTKSFAGAVMTLQDFLSFRARVLSLGGEGTISGSTEIVLCLPKDIRREYRVWIVGGRAVTASMYREGSRICEDGRVDAAVTTFAEETAAIWSPARAFVLDVAETEDGLKVLEVNCLNGAGLYAADVARLVTAIERLEEGTVAPAQRPG